jgi:hypothetical protein
MRKTGFGGGRHRRGKVSHESRKRPTVDADIGIAPVQTAHRPRPWTAVPMGIVASQHGMPGLWRRAPKLKTSTARTAMQATIRIYLAFLRKLIVKMTAKTMPTHSLSS